MQEVYDINQFAIDGCMPIKTFFLSVSIETGQKRKLTFKEKREMELLEQEIAALEEEKKNIEEALCSGTLSVEELTEKSKRLPLLNDELDEKSMRWLELDELAG